jgi:hypothetical protein
VGEDGFVQPGPTLGRTDSLQIRVRPGAGRIAAVRLEVTAGASDEAPVRNAKTRGTFRLALSRRDAAGKMQKLTLGFAEAAAKETRYNAGEDVHGIATGWKVPALTEGSPLTGVWLLEMPADFAEEDQLVATLTGDVALRLRVSVTPFGAGEPLDAASAEFRAALAAEPDRRTPAQRDLLADVWLFSAARDRGPVERYHQLAAALRDTRGGRAWTLVTEATEPLPVRVLPRGNWQDESGPLVLPATPSFLPGRRESAEGKRLTRLDLARWIVSAENPLTARAVVNRLWAMFFGTGLSAVVDDLGSQGELPSHPELLDWLAAELRDGGWDLRHLIRLMVNSATYRQSSRLRVDLREIDPANRLLAAQNPRRLEAEFVRDHALFLAGTLNLRDLGGPSVKPYQPVGYYSQLQFPDRDYAPSRGDEQWRRGLYMHWQRTFLHPMLANFDAPARDECAAQRTVSNTPQQALTLLNDPTFVEAARLFAARVLRERPTDEARLRRAWQLAVARDPSDRELASQRALLARQTEHYRANPAEAEKVLRIGQAPVPEGDAVELAAWTQITRVILNLQETITRY